MTIMSWNLNGETAVSDAQRSAQLDFLESHCAAVDVFCFQAIRTDDSVDDDWDAHLAALLEYFDDEFEHGHIAHSGDWALEMQRSTVQPHADISGTHNRCNLTASRWPLERRSLSLRNSGHRKPSKLNYYYSQFPEKILVTDVDTSGDDAFEADRIEVWNVGIVNGAYWGEEKLKMLETVYGRIYLQNEKLGHPVVLAGDFNAPRRETSEREIEPHSGPAYTNYPGYGKPYFYEDETEGRTEYSFTHRWRTAERQLFDPAVGEWEMRDAYLSVPPERYEASTEDYTHVIHNGTPSKKRLDHILVSAHFDVEQCEILNGRGGTPNGFRHQGQYSSDHAPVRATVRLTN